MAEALREYTHAAEKIVEWYHSLRVDHLSTDELDFELKIRSIEIKDDPTYSRRRRSLREQLKAEKEHKRFVEVELEVNWEETIQFLRRNYEEIFEGLLRNDKNLRVRGRAKLLHFGHRIMLLLRQADGETKRSLWTMLIDVVKLLKKYYYTEPEVPVEPRVEQNFDNLDQALIDLFRSEGDGVPQSPSNVSIGTGTSGSDVNSPLEALLNRISELVVNRAMIPNGSQQPLVNAPPGIQVTSCNQSLFTPYSVHPHFSHHNSSSRSTNAPGVNTSVTFSLPQSFPTAMPHVSTSWHSHLQNNPNFQSFGSTQPTNSRPGIPAFDSMPPSNSYQGTSALNNAPSSNPWLGNPIFSYTQNSNPWLGNQASGYTQASHPSTRIPVSNANPYANPAFGHFNPVLPGNQGRHTLPVSKWTIAKYDGEDQGLKLNQFLGMVHAMSIAEHVSDIELFESAIHLFKGPTLQWYMTMRASGRLLSWQHLVLELRRTFMHPDLDTLIKMKVYQRHQLRNETFLQYYHGMEELFGTMSVPLPEYEKVQILLQNMRIDYKKQLNFLPIADLPTLVSAGQKIDAVNFSVYNKVFGPEKSVNAVDNFKANSTPKNDLSKDKQSKQSPREQQFQSRNNASAHPSSQSHPNQNSSHTGTNSRGPTRPPTTLEEMIDAHQPLSSRHCFNCGKFGHRMDRCILPKGVLCENCGFRGYPSNNCPYCVKNSLAASQNRRPLNPNH